jgi:orotate phosphoribosyltransferase
MNPRRDEIRARALEDLRRHEVVMDGHFDFGNGFHGPCYLNAHQLFRSPSTIWRVAQDLIDILPDDVITATEVVAGPVTGGALLAHTIAGLLEGRRPLTHPPYSFAPLGADAAGHPTLSPFYRRLVYGRRVLLADDVRNTGQTFAQCATLIEAAGGVVIATAEIVDRMEATMVLDAPNIALVQYKAPENFPDTDCPLCRSGVPVSVF